MTKFLASRLDLTRLQAIDPTIILALDYEGSLAARFAKLKELWPEWDQDALETDPMKILQEVDAYRELLDKQSINEGYRAILPAFARGVNLDQIVLRAGILRQDGEEDDDLRMRYFASFGAPSAGSEDAYVFAALTAVPTLRDVAINGPSVHGNPGQVDIVILEPGGVPATSAHQIAVAASANAKSARPLTDMVNVLAATITTYSVAANLLIPRGPDPAALRATVLASMQAITADRYHVGGRVPLAALAAAGYDAGAELVTVSSPGSDIPPDPYAAPWCTGIALTITQRT